MEGLPESVVQDNKIHEKTKEALVAVEENNLASKEAEQALLNLTCPFQDTPDTPAGWPGATGAPTFRTKWKWETTIDAPNDLPEGSTWDAHILMLPVITSSNTRLHPLNVNIADGVTSAATPNEDGNPVHMFSVVTAQTGQLPSYGSVAWDEGAINASPDVVVGTNTARITGQGIEAINISPAISRGGYGYAYRYEPGIRSTNRSTIAGQASSGTYAVTPAMRTQETLLAPPLDSSYIVNFSNTYEGSVYDGIGAINAPSDLDNPFSLFSPTEAIFNSPQGVDASTSKIWHANLTHPFSRWMVSGIFLEGLAPGSSFKIKCKVYLELSPEAAFGIQGDSLVSTSASPGVEHSPFFKKAAAEVLRTLPAGFDYKDNPLGEFFNKVLDVVAEASPTIGKVLKPFLPFSETIGDAVGSLARQVRGKKAKKHKPVRSPPPLPQRPGPPPLPPRPHKRNATQMKQIKPAAKAASSAPVSRFKSAQPTSKNRST